MNDSRKPVFIATLSAPVAASPDAQRSGGGVNSAPLGTNAKCSSTSESNSRNIRKERYALGRIARGIYAAEGSRLGFEYILNYHRTASCSYVNHTEVDVQKSFEHQKCFLTGVATCGSVWTCPTCAAKIQERRRVEIAHGMEYFYYRTINPKQAAMITFTFSHSFGDDLADMLERQKLAFAGLRSGAVWKRFKEVFGFEGLIKSLEVTYGSNGYHPHTHELWFIDKELNRDVIEDYLIAKFRAKKDHEYRDFLLSISSEEVFKYLLIDRWEHYCKKHDLIGDNLLHFRNRSIDVKFNARNSDYLAKQDDSSHWGVDREMAKSSSKLGKSKGLHPFCFLTKFDETGNTKWSKLWLEYSKCFAGKSQIFWSQRLKDKVGIDDLKDEEIAARNEDDVYTVYNIGADWRRVRHDVPLILDTCEKTESLREIEQSLSIITESDNLDRKSTIKERVNGVVIADSNIKSDDTLLIDNAVMRFVNIKKYERGYIYNILRSNEPVRSVLPDLVPYSMKDRYGKAKNYSRS